METPPDALAPLDDQIDVIARERFGYQGLRPGQNEAMRSVLRGRDTLLVMPTGAGKSAVYQIPGLLLDGPTVVVSPLIALQKDQVEGLNASGDDAAHANSTLSVTERQKVFDSLEAGTLEYLFVAPEQFSNDATMEAVRATKPSLFVVDEAHCVSSWGHDFRPEYLQLGDVVRELGHPRLLALTATASPVVRDEIVHSLGMRDPKVIVQGFDRPNISLRVHRFADERLKHDRFLEGVAESETPGIAYVATKRTAEELAGELWQRGVQAVYYHGGMSRSEREEAQAAFMEGRFDVVVATNAFGMGIDKPDVRFVYHYDIPDSLDSYYQEIGRAGRDGASASAQLFFRSEDLGVRRFFASGHTDAARRRLERSRLDMMRTFAETQTCRRGFLLNYFGEGYEGPCGNCDNCTAGAEPSDKGEAPFEINQRVTHPRWKEGSVVRYEDHKIVVLFDNEGYRSLSLELVKERGLLKPA